VARVGLFAPSPSRLRTRGARRARWFRCYPSRIFTTFSERFKEVFALSEHLLLYVIFLYVILRHEARGIAAEPLAKPRSGGASDGANSPTRASDAPEVRSERSGSPQKKHLTAQGDEVFFCAAVWLAYLNRAGNYCFNNFNNCAAPLLLRTTIKYVPAG
jgi:hypothetical protein